MSPTPEHLAELDLQRTDGAFDHARQLLQGWWEAGQAPREVGPRLSEVLLQVGDPTAAFKVAFRLVEDEHRRGGPDATWLAHMAGLASRAAAAAGRIATAMAVLQELDADEDLADRTVTDELGTSPLPAMLALHRSQVRRRAGNPRAALLELLPLMKVLQTDGAADEATPARVAVAVEELTPLFGPLAAQALPDASEALALDTPAWVLRWKAARAWGTLARGGDPRPLLLQDDPEPEDDPCLVVHDPSVWRSLARLDELRLRLRTDEEAGARAFFWRSELLRAWPWDVDNGIAWASLVAQGVPAEREEARELLERLRSRAWLNPRQREELKVIAEGLAE